MATFETTCFFPCLCRACRSVVQVNLLDPEKLCPNCETSAVVPYDSQELSRSPGNDVVAEWNVPDILGRRLSLHDGTYECPSCGMMTLKFSDGGLLWD